VPTIVQIDAATPSATFNKQSRSRNPVIQMHFEPSAYGIMAVGTYIMEFTSIFRIFARENSVSPASRITFAAKIIRVSFSVFRQRVHSIHSATCDHSLRAHVSPFKRDR
jgi:hypothetical protein